MGIPCIMSVKELGNLESVLAQGLRLLQTVNGGILVVKLGFGKKRF